MHDWPDIQTWRRDTRTRLLEARRALPISERKEIQAAILGQLQATLAPRAGDCIGFYWPIKGEIDLRPVIEAWLEQETSAALPVVASQRSPLEFRAWQPGTAMTLGFWNIPVPVAELRAQPSLLLIPLVGFDDQGYRLGYGGGYYDRTLAAMSVKPLCIGVGFADSRLPTLYPQRHDIPMDAILTERGWHVPLPAGELRARDATISNPTEAIESTSPPCAIDMAPGYMGWIDRAELIVRLNRLLEAERAGARGVRTLVKTIPSGVRRQLLGAVADDEAFFCAMLRRQIQALGGTPSEVTGDFYHKLLAVPAPDAQLALLNRGQSWVVRELQKLIPTVQDAGLAIDLRDMCDRHAENIARCDALIAAD